MLLTAGILRVMTARAAGWYGSNTGAALVESWPRRVRPAAPAPVDAADQGR